MSASPDCGLIIFLRLAEKGKVKTRLAQSLGDEEALHVYHHLTDLTLKLAADSGLPVYLYYEGGLPKAENRISLFSYHHQINGDLGEKMQDALANILSIHSKAIIIGSDCPFLENRILNDACAALSHNDIVIGPAEDGGYYLLGCKKIYPEIFHDKLWSTSVVYTLTIESITRLSLKCQSLQMLRDIDTAEDWLWYKKQLV